MIRRLAFTASFFLASALPALAQSHPAHPGQPHPHGPGHRPPDPAHHAAMHALLHGTWQGSIRSLRGGSGSLQMSVTPDSLRKLIIKLSAVRPIQAGAARDVVMDGATLHWIQDLSGQSCHANAVLSAATPAVPETLDGRIACEDGEFTFTLRKAAE